MYENVLLPTDGSDGTGRVVDHALHIARMDEATVHVLHVVDTSVAPLDAHSQSVYDALEAAGRKSVEEIRERALDAGIHAVSAIRRGSPHRELLDYADGNDIDLIVMGTHGRTGLERTLLGSVTERVVRLASAPVLTVRTGPPRAE